MMVAMSPPVFRDTVLIGFSPSLCSARTLASSPHCGVRLEGKPASYCVRVVERLTLWNSGRSASAAPLTTASCAAVGEIHVPTVGDVVMVSMYRAPPIVLTRPLALTEVAWLFVPLLEATMGTCQVPGSVSVLVPAPL